MEATNETGKNPAGAQSALERKVIHRVVAMGWHCFSLHCKHTTGKDNGYGCNKQTNKTGKCLQDSCPVFINARDV